MPDQFIAGLTDVAADRRNLFKYSADSDLQAHGLGHYRADVPEGPGGVRERPNCDRFNSQRFALTTTDSNLSGCAPSTSAPMSPGCPAFGASWPRGLPRALNDSGHRAIAVRPARLGRE
jgi:hypothetical protein